MVDFLSLPVRGADDAVNVVVETPRGSRAKFAFDRKLGVFTLSKALLLGLTYPADFGFVPSTLAEDGDPLDALVLHEAATFAGLVMPCRLIGVVTVVQTEKSKSVRNDRLIVVPMESQRDGLKHVDDLSKQFKKELEKFFVASDVLEEKQLDFRGWRGPKEAGRIVEKCAAAYAGKDEPA
jgi:inorganic pyrophosphatase